MAMPVNSQPYGEGQMPMGHSNANGGRIHDFCFRCGQECPVVDLSYNAPNETLVKGKK
jgi:hypothetical protein